MEMKWNTNERMAFDRQWELPELKYTWGDKFPKDRAYAAMKTYLAQRPEAPAQTSCDNSGGQPVIAVPSCVPVPVCSKCGNTLSCVSCYNEAHAPAQAAKDWKGDGTYARGSTGVAFLRRDGFASLDAEAQAFMQSRVDDYYLTFCKGVAHGRGVPIAQVRNGMGQGRVLGGEAAVELCMVDGIATFDDAIRKILRDARAQAKPRASRIGMATHRLALAQL